MKKWGGAVLAFVFLSTSAGAETTAGNLIKVFKTADPAQKEVVRQLVSSTEDGFSWANNYIEGVRKAEPLYCQPKGLVLTGDQLIDMIQRVVGKDSTLADKP